MNRNTFVEMNKREARIYYVVELLPQNSSLDRIHCVPSTWIRWQSKKCTKVLVAYPDEPWEVTEERVKIYEDPRAYWNLYLAKILDSSNSYVSVIRNEDEQERRIEEPSGSEVIATKSRSPSCSLPAIDSMNESNTYYSEYQRWLNTCPSFVDPNFSTINDGYEIIKKKEQSEVLKSLTGQRDNDINKVLWELWISHLQMNQNLTSSETLTDLGQEINDLSRIAHKSSKNWTLEYREYAPGLVELVNNTGVYIGKKELNYCLALSTKCTQLARLLTRHIFSESALRNCAYLGTVKNKSHLRLDEHATTVISSFVLSYGHSRGWKRLTDRAIKSAMRYELALHKKKH